MHIIILYNITISAPSLPLSLSLSLSIYIYIFLSLLTKKVKRYKKNCVKYHTTTILAKFRSTFNFMVYTYEQTIPVKFII